MRKFISAVVVLFVAGSLFAGEFVGKVAKVEGDQITITVKEEAKTFKVTADTKFTHNNKKQAEKLAAEKLKHPIFARTADKAAVVTITTKEGDDKTAVEIRIGRKPKDK